jgi:hypothetical protein
VCSPSNRVDLTAVGIPSKRTGQVGHRHREFIGASILGPRGAKADDEPPAVNTCREWSDGELNKLGNERAARLRGADA